MNKIGLHYGYWRGSGANENDIYELLDLTAKAGVDVFEIGPQIFLPMSKQERIDLKNAVADKGLSLSVNGGLNDTNDIASDDPAIRKVGIDFCKSVLEAMVDIQCDRWSGINYSAWLRKPTEILDMKAKMHYWQLSVDSMREIIKVAEDCGVDYCFEVVNRFEQFIFNTAKEACAFCADVGSPNAKLLIDTFHMNIEEDSIVDAIHIAADNKRLGHFHVGESNRRVPGMDGKTHLDWAAILGALQDVNYQGYITMEPFLKMGTPGALNIRVWRDFSHDADLAQMVQYAKDGANFIRSFLK
nr:sugar phosphate isomerase/epimerase family protein [Maliibacterium massiliense]